MRKFQWLLMAAISLYMCAFIRSDELRDEPHETFAADKQEESANQSEEAPKLSEEEIKVVQRAFQDILPTLSQDCRTEIEASSGNIDQVSEECKNDVNKKMLARIEEREARKARKESQTEKKQKTKRTKRKKKYAKSKTGKKSNGMRELMIIVYFFAAVFVVVIGYVLFVNRKLKAAGKYFPEDEKKED
uniref:AlNc14C10G1242 protein n=1 Tax=Albugo laibachii Nc14 TaxID=890382 RepID=F0W2J5_9STRA|nr:AlNc14C10G1242 [Albugo laibachii Nc14]|eukprot:CCA15281.1 AlNc14C10G1242 [Albugo laibachii Nc14]